MKEPKFKVGDVVTLMSTSPNLTIEKVNDDGTYDCVWFDGLTLNRNTFKEEVLQKENMGFLGAV